MKNAAGERSLEEAVQLRPDVTADARQRESEIHALEDERVEPRQQSAHTRRAALQLLERVQRLQLRVQQREMRAFARRGGDSGGGRLEQRALERLQEAAELLVEPELQERVLVRHALRIRAADRLPDLVLHLRLHATTAGARVREHRAVLSDQVEKQHSRLLHQTAHLTVCYITTHKNEPSNHLHSTLHSYEYVQYAKSVERRIPSLSAPCDDVCVTFCSDASNQTLRSFE